MAATRPVTRSQRVVVAIDFGTTCTGYAYYYTKDGDRDFIGSINTEQLWTQSGKLGLQAPTTVLMTDEKKFHSFGFEAEKKYENLALRNDHNAWFYFRHFKMTLHHQKEISRNMQLTDDKGKSCSALKIFGCAIEYIRKHLQEQLKLNPGTVNLEDISWVITVPAIWEESAKEFMREAGEMAGVNKRQIILALEPECAAIFCKELANRQQKAQTDLALEVFNPTTQYMIVDLGGGTCDTTIHEVKSNGTLKELHAATGGAWGGQLVDKAFEEFVMDLVTPSVWDKFISLYTKAWILFSNAFDKCKREFTWETKQCMIENFPRSLEEIFREDKGKPLEQDIKHNWPGKVTLHNTTGTLELHSDHMLSFFNQALDPICKHIKDLFHQRKINLKYLILVGGFAESPIVKKRIEKAFKEKVHIIVPYDRGTAVLKGAVMYGIDPSIISSRISPFSYGIKTRKKYDPHIHQSERKLLNKDVVCDAFDIHIRKGQDVHVDVNNKAKQYTLLQQMAPEVIFEVYQSNEEKPLFCDDPGSKCIGKLTLKVPTELRNRKLWLTVWMTCKGTSLVAYATADDHKGNDAKCTCKLDFLRRDVESSSDFVESCD